MLLLYEHEKPVHLMQHRKSALPTVKKEYFSRLFIYFSMIITCGCTSADSYVKQADMAATEIIANKQFEALGRNEPFTIESAEDTLRHRLFAEQHLPFSPSVLSDSKAPAEGESGVEVFQHTQGNDQSEQTQTPEKRTLSLMDALQVAARNSRQYQAAKESVFKAALALDLERDVYRSSFFALLSGEASSDLQTEPATEGFVGSAVTGVSKRIKTGAEIAAHLTFDLVKLMTMDRSSAFGILADATISIPLLRGSGRAIAAETLTQAERDVVYAIWEFERFKKTFAVSVASEYLSVLQQLDQVKNSRENYQSLLVSAQRARRLADAGRLPEIQVDQTIQDELRARNRYISALQAYGNSLDSFKFTLGLPPDSDFDLNSEEFELLVQNIVKDFSLSYHSTNPSEILSLSRKSETYSGYQTDDIVRMALTNRLDLKRVAGEAEDAKRAVAVAADQLRGEATLVATAASGERRTLYSADQPDSSIQPEKGNYTGLLLLDLPLERTRERNQYRESIINLQQKMRDLEKTEDQVKLDVYIRLRDLKEFREGLLIQARSVEVAERRVKSTDLFLQAGRIQVRELLEAREDLVSAQNGLSDAVVNYRVAELSLQRDMGVLLVNEKGLWKEFNFDNKKNETQ
jgi:outer membrane protein TolC